MKSIINVLNIVLDEKFIDVTINLQDLTSSYFNHNYILISSNSLRKFKYIKNVSRILILRADEFRNYIFSNPPHAIFLHSLYALPLSLIPTIPKDIKLVWIGWGYDLYERPLFGEKGVKLDLYHDLTKLELSKASYFPYKIGSKMCNLLRNIYNRNIFESRSYKDAVMRVDYFSGVLPIEYELIARRPYFRAKGIDYKYVYPNNYLEYTAHSPTENNILIGNSANPTNNHFDIFDILSRLNISNRKLYAPLSYGGFHQYTVSVIKKGQSLLGNQFIPLIDFMNKAKYVEIMHSCSIGIFYHERQQALGNINMLLNNGSKVFLSETSPTYIYLRNIGYKVFSIQSELNQYNIDNPLSSSEIANNRHLLICSTTFGETMRRFKEIYRLLK